MSSNDLTWTQFDGAVGFYGFSTMMIFMDDVYSLDVWPVAEDQWTATVSATNPEGVTTTISQLGHANLVEAEEWCETWVGRLR